jgi:hypothetical protein
MGTPQAQVAAMASAIIAPRSQVRFDILEGGIAVLGMAPELVPMDPIRGEDPFQRQGLPFPVGSTKGRKLLQRMLCKYIFAL